MNLFDLFNPYTSLDKRLRLRLGGQQTGDSIIGQDGKGKYLRVEIIDLPLGTTQAAASTGLTSVGLSASGALSVSGSPLTSNGTITLNWTGTSSQYVRGDGTLATLPSSTGTVTSVNASITGTAIGITGVPITTSGTIALAWQGTNLQYVGGDGSLITFPTGLPPTGTAGGDLSGTYPNPNVDRIHGVDMQAGTPSADEVWVYGGSPAKWQHQHLISDQVVEGSTNLFFTNARARSAISLTTTGTSGAATYSSVTGVLNIPQYQAAGTYVTSLSVTTNQGVSGTFTSGSTPALTISLGALTGVTSLNGLVVTANTGVITTGTWNGGVIAGQYGGTGVANTGKTITLGGNLTTSGAFNLVFTLSAATSLTLPTSGTVLSSVTAPANNPITGTPSASTYLRGDGTWASVSASAGGSNTQVQYNSSGALAGSANFTWDNTNSRLVVGSATAQFTRDFNVRSSIDGNTGISIENINTGVGALSSMQLVESASNYTSLQNWNSTNTSSYAGTSVARANTLSIVKFTTAGSTGGGLIYINGTPIINSLGIAGTGLATRLDANGIRLDVQSNIHNANVSSRFFDIRNSSSTSVFRVTNENSIIQAVIGSQTPLSALNANLEVNINNDGANRVAIYNPSTGTSAFTQLYMSDSSTNYTTITQWNNSYTAGSYGGSSIARANSLLIQKSAQANGNVGEGLIYLSGTPLIFSIGTTGTNYSARMDANGFRIGVLSGIGTANTANRIFQADNLQYTTTTNALNIANSGGVYQVNGTQVVSARNTGWSAQTATSSKADLGAIPTTAAIASFCRALYDALSTHGLIGT